MGSSENKAAFDNGQEHRGQRRFIGVRRQASREARLAQGFRQMIFDPLQKIGDRRAEIVLLHGGFIGEPRKAA